jgi:hypothetical protein
MIVVALLVTPVVLLYQGWSYHVFKQRIGGESGLDEAPPNFPRSSRRQSGRTARMQWPRSIRFPGETTRCRFCPARVAR